MAHKSLLLQKPLPVWPDLAKFRHFGECSKSLTKHWGEMLSLAKCNPTSVIYIYAKPIVHLVTLAATGVIVIVMKGGHATIVRAKNKEVELGCN